MNLATITMPRREAEEKLRAYRRALHRRADAEYSAAAKGYAALANGRALLNLEDVVANAPVDAVGRPRLAVCRADRRQVRLHWERGSSRALFTADTKGWWRDGRWPLLETRCPMGRPCPGTSALTGFALVPMVPADHRPSGPLRNFHVLWEVEAWADRPFGAQPDRDPYLLQHLEGALYIVVAAWDLTDLERAIMAGRARP